MRPHVSPQGLLFEEKLYEKITRLLRQFPIPLFILLANHQLWLSYVHLNSCSPQPIRSGVQNERFCRGRGELWVDTWKLHRYLYKCLVRVETT